MTKRTHAGCTDYLMRNIPRDKHEEFKEVAKKQGFDLRALILLLLKNEVARFNAEEASKHKEEQP